MRRDFSSLRNDLGLRKKIVAYKNREKHIHTHYIGQPSSNTDTDDCYFTIHKKPDADFVILNFTDPHFADNDKRALMACTESITMRRLVNKVKPDLITVTGDLICSDCASYSIKKICALFESFKIPWAPVFGNHEDESNMDKNYMADVFMSCPHCIFKKNDPAMGVGNYIIQILEDDRIVEALFMMDSGHSQVNEKQQEWFRRNADQINLRSNKKAEISVLFHIPLPEYQYAFDAAWDVLPNTWKRDYSACGERHEEICCEKRAGIPVQRGFFEILKNAGSVKYVFCGHEHVNNFSILYQGVRLTYTMKVGKASGGGFQLNGGTEIRIGSSGIKQINQKTVSYGPIVNKERIIV